jgi:hypothetical protein
MRSSLVASSFALVVSSMAGSALGQWTAVDLHPVAANSSQAKGVWGDQVVGFAMVDGFSRGSLWDAGDGSWTDLTPSGANASVVRAVCKGRQGGNATFDDGEFGGVWLGTLTSWRRMSVSQGVDFSLVYDVSEDEVVGRMGINPTLWIDGHGTVDLGPQMYYETVFGVDRNRQVGGSGEAKLWSGSAESVVFLRPPQFGSATALGISGDQQVGIVIADSRSRASLWRGSAASWVSLNPLGIANSGAYGVHHGRQVGYTSAATGSPARAAAWKGTADSWEDLHQFLPPGYSFSAATGIWWGRDAVRVCGYARHTESRKDHAILWTLPRCPADFNDDGVVDADDLAAFLEAFDDADSTSRDLVDYTGDDFIDFFDLMAFIDAMNQSCSVAK